MTAMQQYEVDKPPERCETCEHYEYDDWYPGERVCGCKFGPQWGLTVDKYDRCDWWERRKE